MRERSRQSQSHIDSIVKQEEEALERRSTHSFRFPGETESYRRTRNRLLQAEIDLRRCVEEVAALRRQLPLGGQIPEDYIFE